MSGEAQSKQEALAARYNLPAQPEWQQFLVHFDLSQNFALVVLLVTDADGADLCRVELEKQLQKEGKKLVTLEVSSPAALRQIPSQLLSLKLPANAGGIWIAGVEPDYSPNYLEWRAAWKLVMHRLNPRRNEIRLQSNCSLIFVGAPWLQETMREFAPDIWSVRTLVARIEPQAVSETKPTTTERQSFDADETKSGGDPKFALQEAEKLRGVPGKELALARLLHRAGVGFASRSDWRSAESAYAEALQLKRQFGALPDSLLATLNKLSWTCHVLDQEHRSLEYAESALVIARQTGNRTEEGKALNYLGLTHAALGDVRKAIEFHEQQLVIAREIGDRRGEGSSLNNLGNAFSALGESRKAITFYEQALLIHREIGNRNGEGNALMNLGIAYFTLGDARKAIDYYEQALSVFREIDDRRGEGNVLGNLGITYSALGNTRKAVEFYEQILPIFREIGNRRGESYTLGNLGTAYSALGDARKAIEFFEQALIIGRDIGDQFGEANALFNSAVAHHTLGNRAEAIIRAAAAQKIYEAIEHPNATKVRTVLAGWRKQE